MQTDITTALAPDITTAPAPDITAAGYPLTQARALLAQTHGQAGESFRDLTPDMQDAYMGVVDELLAKAIILLH